MTTSRLDSNEYIHKEIPVCDDSLIRIDRTSLLRFASFRQDRTGRSIPAMDRRSIEASGGESNHATVRWRPPITEFSDTQPRTVAKPWRRVTVMDDWIASLSRREPTLQRRHVLIAQINVARVAVTVTEGIDALSSGTRKPIPLPSLR